MPPALAAGVAVAIVMIVYSSAILPLVPDAATMANMTRFDIPWPPGFYGGVTEELLTRWGMMSFSRGFSGALQEAGRFERS